MDDRESKLRKFADEIFQTLMSDRAYEENMNGTLTVQIQDGNVGKLNITKEMRKLRV